jgi:hypothetical protein
MSWSQKKKYLLLKNILLFIIKLFCISLLLQYIEIVESFNIKVHNLCQFLPQDRLEDFSKLDSKGLLLNTLQSIGK